MTLQTAADAETDAHATAMATAWHIHGALVDWTGKGDVKASIALSTELAVATAITALTTRGHWTSETGGVLVPVLVRGGTVLLLLGVLLALVAVVPRSGGAARNSHRNGNFIYFGALRHWDARELSIALRSADCLPVLSEQLVIMSRIAWRKHALVKYSLAIATTGLILVCAAALAVA